MNNVELKRKRDGKLFYKLFKKMVGSIISEDRNNKATLLLTTYNLTFPWKN